MAAPSAHPLAGSLIDGRYRIDREIGRGGFGTVYAALHVGFGAPVALKVLSLPEHVRPDKLADLVGAFFEEARTLKKLRHPGIVAALDVGILPAGDDGAKLPYLVMEWCSGPTLAQHIDERGGPMSLAEAWGLFEPIVDAMAHAHALGIAHRDLKPQNVLLEPDPTDGTLRPRVIDFGIAKILPEAEGPGSGETNTASGSSAFTLRYAAPEQLAGARTGPWTDVHALALIFVEMVTGRPAIGRDDDAALAVIDPVRPTPGALGVDVGALEPVLARALALRPGERHPDAAALAVAMREIAASGWPDGSAVSALAPEPGSLGAPAARPEIRDRTAPPSSHTLRTRGITTVPPPVAGPPIERRAILAVAAIALAVGGAAAVQRHNAGWPFSPRLRDASSMDLERRSHSLGLGICSGTHTADMSMIGCTRGLVTFTRVSLYPKQAAVVAHVNDIARSQAVVWGAARYAVDGDVALIVAARRDEVDAAFAAALGNASFDLRGDPERVPPAKRSAESFQTLASWTGEDVVASVQATGFAVSYANAYADPPMAIISETGKNATVCLYSGGDHRARISMAPSTSGYAIDGSALLMVNGDPAYASVDFVQRLLAGARAAEVGVHPPP